MPEIVDLLNTHVHEKLTTVSIRPGKELSLIVQKILSNKDALTSLCDARQTPFYILDQNALELCINSFRQAFYSSQNVISHFYAVKLNHEPTILKTIFSHGFGADVSSARELHLAKEAGATKFLFSGPGKTVQELKESLDSNVDLIINVDNFSELRRLTALTNERKQSARIGVRINFSHHDAWEKFGIPLDSLPQFFAEAQKAPFLTFCGIQFHMSWNADGQPYVEAIKNLAAFLNTNEGQLIVPHLTFIDIGGGFRPYQGEGYFPEDTPIGAFVNAAIELTEDEEELKKLTAIKESLPPYYITEAVPIESYAAAIHKAIQEYITPIGSFEIYTEPGRILVNSAMHVALRVVDVKSDNCVITDGGTNIVGFERFEFDYFPVINLTHPSLQEREAKVYGSLCMPQDYWGLRAYAEKFEEGDIIIVPYQGALTYSTMNDFIKGKAPVYILE